MADRTAQIRTWQAGWGTISFRGLEPVLNHLPADTAVNGVAASRGLPAAEWIIMAVTASLVLAASYGGWWSISITEAWGFATGGVCVWLVVREQWWNWPIGLANNVAFFALFFHSRLYADMGLQVVYFLLGVYGWWNWQRGGDRGTPVAISRTTRNEWLGLALLVPLGTWGLRELLLVVSGAAPFWDSLTTVISLAAQYLLGRKRLENWWLWIAADVVYVPLYFSRELPLTAALYAVFLVMCVIGLRAWSRNGPPRPRVVS